MDRCHREELVSATLLVRRDFETIESETVDSGDLYDKLMEMTESTEGPRQGEMLD